MKILIAEDDVMLADCLAEVLVEDGHVVCDVVSTVADGVAAARKHRPDAAILDMNLSRVDLGRHIAEQLSDAGDLGRMGIIYVSGESELVLRNVRVGHAYLKKPYSFASLTAALAIVRDIACEGGTSRPLPRGLHLLESAAPRTLAAACHSF